MVFLVSRTDLDRAVERLGIFLSGCSAKLIIIACRGLGEDCIPVREIEDYIIASSYVSESFEPSVLILDQGRIGLFSEYAVVRKRNRQRSLRDLRAEGQFAYEEMVSRQKRTFHRG